VFEYPTADCPDPQFDELTGGDRTHELLASTIPVTIFGGAAYREFFLDSNDSGSDPFMSIEVIKLFLDDQPDLTDYDPGAETFDNDNGAPAATVAWDLDGDGDQTILMNTQGLESGSGVSDISVLVPDSLFPADCAYGAIDCDTYVIFYTEAGGAGVIGDRDYNTTAGFEEWRIELLPVVNVSKDVEIAFDDSFRGGAPTDETWALLPNAENTTFFLSGQTYFEVLWTSPGGNAYYVLAHQYIAAELNVLAGADDSAIATAFAQATPLFETYTPAQIKALKGNNAIRQQFITLAGTLGSYNEGLIGPGHCDEDGSTSPTAFTGSPLAILPRGTGLIG
jgi:hypothetical protein